jgi:phosphate uptake regulator
MPNKLQQLIDAWRGRDLLSHMLDQFQAMLADAEWMYATVGEILLGHTEPEAVHEAFFARDLEINRRERVIRRHIVEDLTLQRNADVLPCLALMSVVKDAERLGDYCKNMYEAVVLTRGKLATERYLAPLHEIRKRLAELFAAVRRAVAEANPDLAKEVIRETDVLSGRCDELIDRLVRDQLPTAEAVGYALLLRHLKRFSAHMGNIATSVVMPVQDLDQWTHAEERFRKTYGSKP